ncbi:MAG TPA: DUF4395 domain-containing protein [Arcobacter sp.]|nr:DUF4395 domain-containing protein [Arcobacter sp.]
MNKYFHFGEVVDGYDTRVINEREARASASIIFLFAFAGFMFVALQNNFFYTELFAFTFLIEFFIRVVINPKYAPYMIIARMIVGNQKPDYVGAPQKRFAWAIGLILGVIMVALIVNNDTSYTRVAVCLICIVFLYLEAAFGICVGCKIYTLLTKNQAKYCPGGVCEMKQPKEDIQKISFSQIIIALAFVGSIYYSLPYVEDRVYAFELTFEELDAMDDFADDEEDKE